MNEMNVVKLSNSIEVCIWLGVTGTFTNFISQFVISRSTEQVLTTRLDTVATVLQQ